VINVAVGITMRSHLVEGGCPAADVADGLDLGHHLGMDDMGNAVLVIALTTTCPVNSMNIFL
jgi:hypothetical protein